MQTTDDVTSENAGSEKRLDSDQRPIALASERLGKPARIFMAAVLFIFLAPAAVSLAQGSPPPAAAPRNSPIIAYNKSLFGGVKRILLRSAEKMPEENYGFKPADAVRSYGQIVGHVADSQYAFCSAVLGEKSPAPKVEQTKSSKADLIAALRDAFAYCDRAFDGMTDGTAVQAVKFGGGDKPKLGVLIQNNLHTIEHYGNLITYMRMKNIVPPTSDPEFMRQLSK